MIKARDFPCCLTRRLEDHEPQYLCIVIATLAVVSGVVELFALALALLARNAASKIRNAIAGARSGNRKCIRFFNGAATYLDPWVTNWPEADIRPSAPLIRRNASPAKPCYQSHIVVLRSEWRRK